MNHTIKKLTLLSLLGAGMASGGLVSHYTFDETSGTTAADTGPAAANGVIGTNVTLGVPGKFGTAFTFNNDTTQAGIVDMANATGLFSAISTSQALTVSVWLKWTTPGARDSAIFLGDNTVANRYLDIGTVSASNGVYGRVRNGVNTGFPDLTPMPATPLNNDQWHHVAYTVSAATQATQVYVDGVLAGSTTTPAAVLPSVFNNFEVGRLGRGTPADAFAGSVDELRVYDSVLSASEIQVLAQGPAGDPSLLVASSFSFTNNGLPGNLTLPFTNTGTSQTLVLTAPTPVVIGGTDAARFSVNSFSNNIAPGASGNIVLSFNPPGAGLYQSTLTIASNDSQQPSRQVTVNVEVVDPVGAVSPPSIDFGLFETPPAAETRNITISNTGGASILTVSDLILGGSPVFSSNVVLPIDVPPGQSRTIPIKFAPAGADGVFNGLAEMITNGYNQAVFAVPLTASVKIVNPDASLVSHFTFDNQASVGDDSGPLNHDGTVVGNAAWNGSARVGSGALKLDGDGDLIDLGTSSGPSYTSGLVDDQDGFTVACWVNVSATTAVDRTRFFSAYANGAATLTEGWGVGRRNTSAALVATTLGRSDYLAPAASAPAAGAWHHQAYVFRNVPVNRVDFYVDGVLVNSITAANTGFNDAATVGFAIGALGRSTAFEGFDGLLDDLRIYDRELLAANIQDLQGVAPVSGYNAWAESFGLVPAGNGAPLADPDHDGLSNAVEFYLGSSPVSGTRANVPLLTKGANSITFVYRRKLDAVAAGFQGQVESSTLLTAGSWQTAVNGQGGVTVQVTPVDAATEEVTVVIPATGPKTFARLRVVAQ
ncbi:MAG: choice-of-anchor D domain-containing protein [Verrucomicrobiaceae bacterium]|nr:MAG: choice-of-anchor D domain-containing protein [Verrucomicrobiaceae bacterium]